MLCRHMVRCGWASPASLTWRLKSEHVRVKLDGLDSVNTVVLYLI